jgi:hypothetical protein
MISKPIKKLFHNVEINVYPAIVPLESITYWKENLRTLLSFKLLEKKHKKKLPDITTEEIVGYLARKRALQIEELAKSIEKNGVRVPLIILEKDGTLLDGNRRYFACQFLLIKSQKEKKSRPSVLDSIPVWMIKDVDMDSKKQQKILAEANFVSDYKVEWTLDVKANVIYRYFKECIKNRHMTREEAYDEILDVYSVKRSVVTDYIDSVKLSLKFIKSAPLGVKDRYREIVQDKFVYFWQFKNKAYAEKLSLDANEKEKLEKLFFEMMSTDRFKNIKQIEPMIRSVRDKYAWKIIVDSSGSKIDQIEAMYMDQKSIKAAEDKIRYFHRWLLETDIEDFSNATIKLLKTLVRDCKEILKAYK